MPTRSASQSGQMGLHMLQELRKGHNCPPETKIAALVKHMQDSQMPLRTIGTSKEELEEIRKKWYIDRAKFELEVLRRGNNSYFWWHLSELWRYVRRGDLSINDIGTSEWELGRLRRRNRRSLRKQKRLLEKIS